MYWRNFSKMESLNTYLSWKEGFCRKWESLKGKQINQGLEIRWRVWMGFFSLNNRYTGAFWVAEMVKNLSAMQETWVWSLGQEDPLEEGITTHSSILAWRIPWTEEPGRLAVHGVAKSWTRLSDWAQRYTEPSFWRLERRKDSCVWRCVLPLSLERQNSWVIWSLVVGRSGIRWGFWRGHRFGIQFY